MLCLVVLKCFISLCIALLSAYSLVLRLHLMYVKMH